MSRTSKSRGFFELAHALVCEDVRMEAATNKGIYIGVFTGEIIAPSSPVRFDRLSLVFTFRETGGERVKTVRIETEGPEGTDLPTLEDSTYDAPAGAHTVTLMLSNVQLFEGQYVSKLTVNGSTEVRLPFSVIINPNHPAWVNRELKRLHE